MGEAAVVGVGAGGGCDRVCIAAREDHAYTHHRLVGPHVAWVAWPKQRAAASAAHTVAVHTNLAS